MDLLQAIEHRLESQMDRKMETIESGFETLKQQITNGRYHDSEENFERHYTKIQSKIKSISDFVGGGPAENNGQDRKRLKEKLKEAMRADHTKSVVVCEREAWMEYLFGICKPDGRIGKPGSRQAAIDSASALRA
jgi:hypothetical protein